MSNKMNNNILKTLRVNGDYISAKMLSRGLDISRISIKKHINDLKQDRHALGVSLGRYCLISSPEVLSSYKFPKLGQKICRFRKVGSTMGVARKLAERGGNDGTVIIADSQTNGRGRLNRKWISPKGGVYFTFILRPKIDLLYISRMNLMVSVSIAKAIKNLFGLNAELKWPNDVLIEGRKVCGILVETEIKANTICFINIGVGINANTSISHYGIRTTSLKEEVGKKVSIEEVLIAVLEEINKQQVLLNKENLLCKNWKNLSTILNKNVKIVMPAGVIEGKAIDVLADGTLIIKDKNGVLKKATAGDCFYIK